jgi:hypothetical protein
VKWYCDCFYLPILDDVSCLSSCFSDSSDDKHVPTLVEGLLRHKIVQADCGSDDAHTLALESNGQCKLVIWCARA